MDQSISEAITILVADDDPGILDVAVAVLNRFGYEVLTARDGQAALQVFQAAESTVQLVISDCVMPRVTGPQLIRSIKMLSPSTATLLMSGTPASAPGSGIALAKPFTIAAFASVVKNLLAGCDFAEIEREQSVARSLRFADGCPARGDDAHGD